jgi:hypothetical protein
LQAAMTVPATPSQQELILLLRLLLTPATQRAPTTLFEKSVIITLIQPKELTTFIRLR